MLAEIDPFNCLNFCASCRSTLNRIESWTYRIDNQNEYISLYRQHGGKYYCEIFKEALRKEKEQKQEKTEEKIKTPASVCVIS
jgi:hypothetical protein